MDVRESGFKSVTRLGEARDRLREALTPHDRTDTVPLTMAEDRVLATAVTARRRVPHYDRAAMDGFAVRAADTFGAGDRSPAILRERASPEEPDDDPPEVGPDEAVRVHTGSELPPGADAVVMVEHTDTHRDEVEVFDAVAEGENVAPAGEDVEREQALYEPGHRLRPSDLGLCKSVGVDEVECYQRPEVAITPTGEELVQRDPAPGEVIETNGLTVAQYVERWGGKATYRNVVTDNEHALRAAIERDLVRDVIVTTGGSSVGERDLIPEVVDELGEVLVHGVALKPGHPVGFGVVRETPVIMLPGYPVACIVNAVQFLRPAIKWSGHLPLDSHPTTEAVLGRKIKSEPGVRTFARVQLRGEGTDDPAAMPTSAIESAEGEAIGAELPTAEPTRASGAGVLSSVALADGWVVVPEGREGFAEGERVRVQDWEWSA
jgi:molybdopterin molybdotransferase